MKPVLAAVTRGDLPRLRGLPEFVVDNAELRHVDDHERLGRIESRQPLAGLRVFHEPLAVPHQLPDVELIIQDARAALR